MPLDPLKYLQKIGELTADNSDLDPEARKIIVEEIGRMMPRVARSSAPGPSGEDDERGAVPTGYRPPQPPSSLGGPDAALGDLAKWLRQNGLEFVIRPASSAGRA